MIWAGACSNTNFPTLKMPKNAKKAKCDRPTDGQTDRLTDKNTIQKHLFFDKQKFLVPVGPFIMVAAVNICFTIIAAGFRRHTQNKLVS